MAGRAGVSVAAERRRRRQANAANAAAKVLTVGARQRIGSGAQASKAPSAQAKREPDVAHAATAYSNALVALAARGHLDNHPLPPPRGPPVPFGYVPVKTELAFTTTLTATQVMGISANLWTPRRPVVMYVKTGGDFATDGASTHQDADSFVHSDAVTLGMTPNNIGDLDPPTMGGNAAGTGFYQPIAGRLFVEVIVPYAGHAVATALTGHPRLFGVEAGPDYTNEQGTLNNTGLIQYKTLVNSSELLNLDAQPITGSSGRYTADIPVLNHQGSNWMKFTDMAHAGAPGNDESRMGNMQDAITYGGPAVRIEAVTGNCQVRISFCQYGYASVHESSVVNSLAQRHTLTTSHGGHVLKSTNTVGEKSGRMPTLTKSGITNALTSEFVTHDVKNAKPGTLQNLTDAMRYTKDTAESASSFVSEAKTALKEVSSFGRSLMSTIEGIAGKARPVAASMEEVAPLLFSV